jgi:hypothetical protein
MMGQRWVKRQKGRRAEKEEGKIEVPYRGFRGKKAKGRMAER